MNREAQNTQGKATRGYGWVFYDGHCPICCRWARRFKNTLLGRRFLTAPLQRGWVQERLGLGADVVLNQMHVIAADGTHFGGADAMVFLAGRIWWAQPAALLSKIPGVMRLYTKAYRFVAKRRNCGTGNCSIAQPTNSPATDRDQQEHAREADRAA